VSKDKETETNKDAGVVKNPGKDVAKHAGKDVAKSAVKDAGKSTGKDAAKAAEKTTPEPKVPARIFIRYKEKVVPALMKRMGYKNIMQVPHLEKIVINTGMGAAIADAKIMDEAVACLRDISGQKPVVTLAKKAISNFKLRENAPIGCKVTLRGDRMWEFFDRLVSVAIPRIRDFRGLPRKSFDGQGNYTIGIKEQIVFLEIDRDKVSRISGMDITICSSAKSNEDGLALLEELGMPFRKQADSADKKKQSADII
jgi:large subunit ribosomal protein L5